MLGEVVGRHEGEDVGTERIGCLIVDALVVASLTVRFMRSAWPLVQVGPSFGPTGVVGLGQPVLDAVLVAHAVEDVKLPRFRGVLVARRNTALKIRAVRISRGGCQG